MATAILLNLEICIKLELKFLRKIFMALLKKNNFFPVERLEYFYKKYPNYIAISSKNNSFTYEEFFEYSLGFSKNY